jgi:hypothetical protein
VITAGRVNHMTAEQRDPYEAMESRQPA